MLNTTWHGTTEDSVQRSDDDDAVVADVVMTFGSLLSNSGKVDASLF